MKKKVFSKLLMGALLVASVSSFTSCKDYDDDINDLRSQINGLNTSLSATIADKEAALSKSITTLTEQLAAVKTDYAKADEALQAALNKVESDLKGSIEANKTNISSNLSAINDLKQEVVNLKATDTNLQKAIDALQAGQNEANALIKSQGESILGLAAADLALEKAINAAQAQADNALAEAQKAQTAAATNAANLATTNSDVANLQKTVEKNLSDVNAKIAEVQTTLEGRIKTNEGNIAELQKKVSANEANITTATTKLGELAAKDAEIEKALNTAKETLAQQISDGDKAQADALTAQVEKLQTQITANKEAIALFNQQTLTELRNDLKTLEENLKKHDIPEAVAYQVAKQIPDALKDYMKSDDINKLINDENLARVSAIEALQKKAKQDSTDLAQYSEGLALLTAAYLVPDGVDFDKINAPAEASVTALVLAGAIKAADQKISDEIETVVKPAIEDMKDAEKEGSLANLIAKMNDADDATSLAGKIAALKQSFEKATDASDPNSLAGRFETIENFFAPAEAGQEVSVDNLAAKIAETETFAGAVADAANEANGEILGMITAIHLFANQHMAQHDEYGKVIYTNGTDVKYPVGYGNFDHELNFVYAIEQGIYDAQLTQVKEATWNFPEKYIRDDIDNTKGYVYNKEASAKEDVDYYQFIDGRYRSYADSVLVRVSPVNADLSKAKIALLNSRGEDIIDAGLVELVGVHKYQGVLTRAAAGNETGLWVIKFKLNDGEVGDKWLQYSTFEGRPIIYAVAVKTTGISVDEEENIVSDGVERYVASEYDLSLATEPAKHAYTFDVNNINIEKIHNRYIQTDEAETGGTRWTDDKNYSTFAYELLWVAPCDPETQPSEGEGGSESEVTPTSWWYEFCHSCSFDPEGQYLPECYNDDDEFVGKNETGFTYVYFDKNRDGYEDPAEECYPDINAQDRVDHSIAATGARQTSGRDNRHLQPKLPIEFNQTLPGETGQWAKIDIEFPAFNACGEATPIKGFFVTLDQQFSKESGNSEINAWWHYIYKNVALTSWNYSEPIVEKVVLQNGNKGTIWIKDDNNLNNGDVIGFRVHAVNLDGTLYDPDGRAFYVQVGKQTPKHELSFDITVTTSDANKDSAWAVQNLVDGKNPIAAYNEEQKSLGSDDRFFNRAEYNASYIPTESYRVVYTWREDNPAIKGKNNNRAYIPMAGTGKIPQEDGSLLHGNANDVENGGEISVANRVNWDVEEFFNFMYSENPNATIDEKTEGVDNKWAFYNYNYASNKFAANRLTSSVKATIRPAAVLRLQDEATYKITATIQRLDDQTNWKTVNVIDIDITKKMPTNLPSDFKINSLQNKVVTFYMRPDTVRANNLNPWQITWQSDYDQNVLADKYLRADGSYVSIDADDLTAAELTAIKKWQRDRWMVDARPFTMEEIFHIITKDDANNDIVDPDYYFVVEKGGSRADADVEAAGDPLAYLEADKKFEDADAYIYYGKDQVINGHATTGPNGDKPAYYLPKLNSKHLGETLNVKAGYIYRQISAKYNETTKKFYNPTAYTLNAPKPLANGDYELQPIYFDKDGKAKESESDIKFAFNCALDKALTLVEWSAKKDKTTKVRFMTDIKYRNDIRQVVLTKWMTAMDNFETIANAKNLVNGWYTGYTIPDGEKLCNFEGYSLDHISKYGDEATERGWNYRFLRGGKTAKGIAQGYWDAQFGATGNASEYKSLTELLADSVLKVVDLNPNTITISDFKAGKTAQQTPTGTTLDYNPRDYFDIYYADKNGNPVTKSSDIAGVGFKLSRTQLLPALTQDVYAIVSFPVVDVWNHERTNIKLYVRFMKPENLPASGARQGR